jgi:FkbM family methyltransferase
MLADDPRVPRAWRHKWDTAHFIKLLRWHDDGFRPGVVYDIGAHEGVWSEMCQAVFAPAKCLLFEPQREVRERAMTRRPPPPANWQMLPVALGDHQETQSLHLSRNLAASSLLPPLASGSAALADIQTVGEEKVEVVPLDMLVATKGLPKPDFVKIDVQGFEGRVLAGGQQTLSATKRMVIEVSLHPLYDGQTLMAEVLQTLSAWGFELDDVQEAYRKWPGPLQQVDLWLKKN